MNISLNEKTTAILMIILGIIALLFPMVSTQSIGIFSGIIILLIAIGLFICGVAHFNLNRLYAFIYIIFAILCAIFAHQLIFNTALISSILGFTVYLIGFILIIIGIINFISGSVFAPFSLIGISTIIFGIITIITGMFIDDPKILGTIIGLWLIVSGLLALFTDKNKNYVDI